MMPACRSMDSYPYQRNQMPFPPCYYPGIEANSSQMKMDPPKPPFSYEQPWHYGGSYGHPIPMHFCCGHNNFPAYYSYRPSYHHASVPSPMYYSGGYPACGEPFFAPYSPQPHYTMELPRYEYEKYVPRDYHCCGCPNHPCHQKAGRSVKIEEEEPDAGKKVNDALAPIQVRNYPYPIVWIPPEYTSNKEPKNAHIAEVGEQDKTSHDRKPPSPRNFRADAQEPRVWNGWLPFDMNRVPNMVREGDQRRSQNWEAEKNRRESEDGGMSHKNQSEQKRSEFPFPIIWMPYYNKQEEGGRGNNQESSSTPKCIEEVPHIFNSVPVNSQADEGVTNGTVSNQVESTNTSGSDATKEVTNEKTIPVKELKFHEGKNYSEGSGKRERIIPVKQMEENVTKKDSHPSMDKQSTSPQKNGKLPPVCLRVDPLPGKKNGNGSSRSPSPPASKEHSKAKTGEKVLADMDAAILIQAAYRGYQVRKWEPLKKLKQIAEVSKELTDVRGRIQALEHSSDLQLDEKQKIAIGETIMRLLLKLDTIQVCVTYPVYLRRDETGNAVLIGLGSLAIKILHEINR